jgi:hypothetical protein
MRGSLKGRALVIGVAAGSLLLVPLAAPASAVTQPAKCGKITTKTVGKVIHITVSKCTPLSATGGSGTGTTSSGTGALKGKTVNKITWASKHGTSTMAISFAPTTLGKCPKTTTRLSITGKVTASTGLAAKVIKKGQPVTAKVCVNKKTAAVALEPGTVEKF